MPIHANNVTGSATSTGSFSHIMKSGVNWRAAVSESLSNVGFGSGGGSGFDYTSGSSPVVTTNPSSLGATWINTTSGEIFVCNDITTGENNWLGTAGTEVSFVPAYFGSRGLWNTSVIDYVTIATPGNAIDFGDLSVARSRGGACSNATRGVFGGGFTSTYYTVIDYVTIATTGNAIDFGDLTLARYGLAACSDGTKGVFGGKYNNGDTIDYVTIASTGNATDFGDLTVPRGYLAACSDGTKGVFGGGYVSGNSNVIDYVTIASTGNASDFGDLSVARFYLSACSGT
jgi:hypothetical protein